MKKINLIFALLLAALFLIALLDGSGAQQRAERENEEEGMLIGFIATREYLDLDELTVSATGKLTWEKGRLYAESTGTGWYFPGIEGDGIFCVNGSAGDGVPVVMNYGNVQKPQSSVSVNEEDGVRTVNVTLSGELYTGVGEDWMIACNPVYQLPDGRVYLTAGNTMSVGGGVSGESTTMRLSAERSKAFGDTKSIERTEASISVVLLPQPVKLILTHFDANDRILKTEEFLPHALPEAITPAEGAQYILAELQGLDGEGGIETSYAIDDRDTLTEVHPHHTLTVHARGEDGRLALRYLTVNWEEGKA